MTYLKTPSTKTSPDSFNHPAIDYRCTECAGEGVIVVIEDGCHHGGGTCPCATTDVECADCRGTGVVLCGYCGEQPASELGEDNDMICRGCKTNELNALALGDCDHCGEPATHRADYTKQPVCDECDPEEPRGDHPLGGMGYGIDYREAQAQARRLK